MKKRILSIIMVLSMCLSMLPTAAFAAEDTGLCEHHPVHTAECGYAEAVAGADCTHEHTADCYTNGVLPESDADSSNAYELEGDTEQTNTLLCAHTHDEGCYVTNCVHAHDGECGYTEAVPCGHEHDAECGYAPVVEEVTCACTETGEDGQIVHMDGCGYVAPVEGTPCGHTAHDETCGYVEAAPCAHVCNQDTGCVTLSCTHVHDETCSSAGELACQHVHDDTCGYVEAVEASPCTYECELCGLTEITAWSWIDQWEMLDPDTGVLALPGASEDTPALFDDIVPLLPVEITATVEGGEETVALDGWTCPGYPEEGAYSGNYIFTAALPEGYGLAEDAPALTVTVELGGAALFAGGTYNVSTSGSLTINSSNKDQYNGATITGELTLDTVENISDILVIDGVTVDLTIENLTLKTYLATTSGYSPIDLRNGATLNLTVKGNNTLTVGWHAAGIHVPEGCTLNITAESTGTLTVNGGNGYGGGAGIGADGNGYIDGSGSTTQTCGTINIAGGTIIATGGTHYIGGVHATAGGAGIGGSTTGTSGGVASTGKITISGGNVTATGGGQSAGIGGGECGYVESISITGGTVTAAAEVGAAIGTGQDGTNGIDIACGDKMKISITGGTVTADGNIGYGEVLQGSPMTGGSVTISTNASVVLTDGHKIDHGDASNYAIIPVTLNVYDGRLTDTTEWVTMEATQSGSRVGGASVELAVSDYHGTAKLNFVVPSDKATGETNFIVTTDGFTVTGSAALTTSGVTVNCGQQLYPVTLTFLDDAKFTSDTNDYTVSDLTVKTDGGSAPDASAIMATLPNTIEYHSASMGTMVVWLAAGTYNISVTQSDLKAEGAMTGTITVTGSATLNLLNNSSVQILGNLDLSYGPIKFYKDGDAYKVDYYATAGASAATTATVLVSAPFVVTQSGDDTTTNTITVTDWGAAVPLDLTIDGLNIETSTLLVKDNNANYIDINGSAVNLNLSGSSSLKSTYNGNDDFTAALVSVDGTSSLTIDGSGSLSVNTYAYALGAAIGGDAYSEVGTITIKGGTVTAVGPSAGAAIGTGYGGATAGKGHAVITITGGTVTANGGTAIGAGSSQSINANTASVTITGGEVNATGIIGAYFGSATVDISGGTVNVTADTARATIGGMAYYSEAGANVSVTIRGGTVDATNTDEGPAIGGSGYSEYYSSAENDTGSSVTINGGTVSAINSSTTAAAIGASSGSYRNKTDVTISGGRVTATNSADDGVAIGGGYTTNTSYTDPYTYTNVTITGGTVDTTGVIGSAAQVEGYDSNPYATVKITGGSVNGEVWAYSDADTNTGATNGTDSVYMITADLSSTVGTDAEVTSASITGNTSYGFNDVYTDADGKIYLWLPGDDTSETKAAFNGGNYTGTVKTDNTGVFTADKLTPTVTAPTANTLTYNGEAQALVAAGSTIGGELQYALGTDSTNAPTENWSTAIPTSTDAKTYYVWYKVEGNDEYADVAATCVTVTIAQRAITVKADDQTVLQNNQPDSTKISVTSGSLVTGHSLTATLKTVADVATLGTQTDALEIDTSTIMSGGTNVSSNYNVTTVKGTLTVATHTHSWNYEQATTNTANDTIMATCISDFGPCPVENKTVTITLTAPTGDDLIYNGSPIVATATSSSTELTAPTEITYTATNGGTLTDNKPVNAGTYTASITVDGKTAQVTYTIAAKSIADAVITLSATGGDYNGNAQQPTVSSVELNSSTLTADNYTVSYLRNGTATTDFTNAGTITVVVEGKGNYTGKAEKTYTINPIAPTAANFNFTAPSNLTYSGTAKAAIVAPATGITGMGAVTVKYYKDGVETTPTNVGTYTVKISVAEGTNYTVSTNELTDATWTFTIGKATLTITADNKSMLTGSTMPTLTCSYSGFVNGETKDVLTTQPIISTTANGQTAGSFDIAVSGAEAANYEISYENGTLTVSDHVHAWTYTADDAANTITASCGAAGCPTPTQVITLAAPTGDLTYTGSAKEATVSGSIDGVATPTISYTGSLTDGKPVNAGSYTAAITVEGKSVSVDIVIGNASQTAPSVSAKNETIKGAADGGITGATADMEYSATSGGTYATIPEKLAAGTYYVRYKAKTNYDPSPDTTVTIAAGPAIAVTFNVDGGTPAPDAQSLSYKEKVTRPPNPAKEDYAFLGWDTDSSTPGKLISEYNFDTEVTDASLTLTAKWKQVAFKVGVDIKDSGGAGVPNIPVKLMKGSNTIATGTTDESGHVDFSHISTGAYNVVATFGSGTSEQTRTALVTLTGDSTVTINKPTEGVNSHLNVSDDSDTPAVVVGGLDTEAEELKKKDQSITEVSVSMAVEGQKEAEVEDKVVAAIEEEIKKDSTLQSSDPVVEYLDITLSQTITRNDGGPTTTDINQTSEIIEIVIPFPGGRSNVVVIRYHGSLAEIFTQASGDSRADKTFRWDTDSETLHIYTQKFSTYAIAYTTAYTITFDANGGVLNGDSSATTASNGTVTLPTTNPTREDYTFKGWYTAASGGTQVTASTVFKNDTTIYAQWTQNQTTPPDQPNPPSSGGGGGVSTYAITVEDAEGGSVKSDRTRASYGSTVTITVTPDEGYKLGSLTVKDASGRKIEVTDKGDGKYTFKMPSGRVTVEASFVSDTAGTPCDGGADCPSTKFIDIDPNAWYHEALDYAIENSLMNGYGNGYFGPNDDLSRGMLAQILYNLEGRPAVSGDMPFTDVEADRYYFDAILWAQQNGIVGGYGGGLFGPDDPITREQLAVMLWRYAGSPAATKKELDFTDADEASDWAVDALIWAQENGIMVGDNNAVNPKGNASRAHVAQMLMKFLKSL